MPTVTLTVVRFTAADRADWLATAVTVLSVEEREQISSRPDSNWRTQHAIGRALLRLLAADATGCPPAEADIAVSDDGKPWLRSTPEIGVSVAHTGTVVVTAACHGAQVGIDIEPPPRDVARARRIAERRFSEPEATTLRRLPDAGVGEWFARAWTTKEAVGKAVGSGVFPALSGATVNDRADLLVSVWSGPPAESWTLHQMLAHGGEEWIAVAIPAPGITLGPTTELTFAAFSEAAARPTGA